MARSVALKMKPDVALRAADQGVARKLSAKSMKTALAAADMIIVAYAKFPDMMREAGVLSKDVEKLTGLAGALCVGGVDRCSCGVGGCVGGVGECVGGRGLTPRSGGTPGFNEWRGVITFILILGVASGCA